MRRRVSASSAPNGSSRRRVSGSLAIADASASRCRWPPERVAAGRAREWARRAPTCRVRGGDGSSGRALHSLRPWEQQRRETDFLSRAGPVVHARRSRRSRRRSSFRDRSRMLLKLSQNMIADTAIAPATSGLPRIRRTRAASVGMTAKANATQRHKRIAHRGGVIVSIGAHSTDEIHRNRAGRAPNPWICRQIRPCRRESALMPGPTRATVSGAERSRR